MKNLMNLGKVLNKNEQKVINGGNPFNTCSRYSNITCPPGMSVVPCPMGPVGYDCA